MWSGQRGIFVGRVVGWVLLLCVATNYSFRLVPHGTCRSSSSSSSRSRSRHGVGSLRLGIDVSGLPFVPIPEDLQLDAAVSAADGTWSDLSNALILFGGVGYLAYEKRPRGSARDDLIEVRQSKIPGANLGVFAKKVIPEGTVIGRFPGFVATAEDALASKSSDKARESAKKYMYALNEEQVIDPTNADGTVDLEITFLFGLIKVDTTIARINEPPVGGDVNVFTRIDATGVSVIAERNIFNGEEVFMDYGRVYDRSDYEREEQRALEAEMRAEAKKRSEEEEMMRLQPVTTDQAKDGRPMYDQDTSLADGFIGKLAKADESKYKKAGIISPEEGAGMFTDMGVNMFGSNEDRELLEAITGKSSSSSSGGSDGASGKAKMVDFFSRGAEADDELLKSLKDQIGKDELEEGVAGAGGKGASASSLFDALIGGPAKAPARSSAVIPTGPPAPAAPPAAAAGGVEYRPALTVEQAEELTRSLDDMTDAEVARVLQKLQKAVGDQLKQEMAGAIAGAGPSDGPKQMPRAPVLDPEIRKKYGSELNAIEDELEKIYSDPLGVWQELMANPEKFLDEEKAKSPEDLTDDPKQ